MYIWHHTHKHLPSKNAKKPWIFWGSAHRYAHTQNRYIHTYYIFVLWWSYIRWIEYVFIPRIISRWFCKNHIISAPGWLSPSLSICIGRKLKIRHSIMAEVLLHVLHTRPMVACFMAGSTSGIIPGRSLERLWPQPRWSKRCRWIRWFRWSQLSHWAPGAAQGALLSSPAEDPRISGDIVGISWTPLRLYHDWILCRIVAFL
jgi:hypothetical protein